jgi:pyruvate kinase
MCRSRGKVVIVATQMLDSMIRNPRPTRAEANDVANAVLDGADAVMLSGETASGSYPMEAVSTMRRIVDRTERELEIWARREKVVDVGVPDAVSAAAVLISKQVKAAAIVCLTKSGTTARMISKHRPTCPVLGVTPSRSTWRELSLWWGIYPVKLHELTDINVAAKEALAACIRCGHIREGELAVITAGLPLGLPGTTNMVEVLTTGEVILSGTPLVRKNATGKVCVVRGPLDLKEKFDDGCILVAQHVSEDIASVLDRAGAVIAESGANFEGNIWALEHDVPCVIGVLDALFALTDGMEVTVDGMRGLVYRGRVKLVI